MIVAIRRLGKFVGKEELEHVKTEQECSGMFLSGGLPMGDPSYLIRMLASKYGFNPNITGLDTKNGEFVERVPEVRIERW